MKYKAVIQLCELVFVILVLCGAAVSGIHVDYGVGAVSFDRGDTLYVGGGGPGNYSKIQDAIDNASYGDTVFVFDDSSPYYENIVVHTTITLCGESMDDVVVHAMGNDYGILVTASNVVIEQMSVELSDVAGVYLTPDAHDTVVRFVNVSRSHVYGVLVNDSDFNHIEDCVVSHSTYGLFFVNQCSNNWVLRTEICSIGQDGIVFVDGSGLNVVRDCVIFDCHIGVFIEDADGPGYGNYVILTTIHDCDYGVYIEQSSRNEVDSCTITDIAAEAITVYLNCFLTNIVNNIIDGNGYGIFMWESVDNIIQFNRIRNSTHSGIYLQNPCTSNDITNNVVKYNEYGVRLSNFAQKNKISSNTFESNYVGVYLQFSCWFNRIEENNFYFNDIHARFINCLNIWQKNYWHEWLELPKPIFGKLKVFPWVQFDWSPAIQPH